jgi:hypothetical protein
MLVLLIEWFYEYAVEMASCSFMKISKGVQAILVVLQQFEWL